MPRTFLHEVTVNISLDHSAIEAQAVIEFTCTPLIPATYDDPAEGGEVEIIGLVELFLPAQPSRPLGGARERETLECPPWLSDWICAEISDEELFDTLGADAWDDNPD